MQKGALHIHSTYSDGEFTLAELRRELIAAGCQFACVTDHAEWFDAARLESYRRECSEHSDATFRFVAGLEYSCVERMHILGYGVTTPIDSSDPEDVIEQIRARGGIAVIAHPKTDAFSTIEGFDTLPDGVEVWNSKYDGQYAPRPGTFALLQHLKARRPQMMAFYGQDLHWRKQHRGLFVEVGCATPDGDAVLNALRRGDFVGTKSRLRLPSSGIVPPEMLERFESLHERSQELRNRITQLKSWVDRTGIAVPRSIKTQLRRIF